ncbi:hypothetical protein LI328DRAFT_138095 [Trichoderma asperelloides]|nr:hypothetical protein LI328DRAFT_138095 [Trichoderma asperelloides]
MLFKTTILLPAIVALGLATAVPGPEVEDDLVARGPEVEEDLAARGGFIEDDLAARDLEVEDDLAARGGHPDCGQFASWSSQFNRCFCRQPGYIFYPNGKFCCQRDYTYYPDGRVCCPRSYFYDHQRHRCCRRQDYDFKHGRCRH